MKKTLFSISSLILLLVLTGCSTTYKKSVNDDLLIPYPYIPPNAAFHPYTLLQFTSKGGFQEVCPASLITGLSENKIQTRRILSPIATIDIKKNHKAEFDIKLSRADIGTANAKFLDIKKVEVSFQNGKQVSMPSVRASDAILNITKTKCKDDIKLYASAISKSEFFLPTIVFSYDMKYHMIDKNGFDVTAELSKELQKVVLGKIGIGYESGSDIKMVGNNLYIGFRGLPVKESRVLFEESLVGFTSSPEKRDWAVIDVSETVKAVASGKQSR